MRRGFKREGGRETQQLASARTQSPNKISLFSAPKPAKFARQPRRATQNYSLNLEEYLNKTCKCAHAGEPSQTIGACHSCPRDLLSMIGHLIRWTCNFRSETSWGTCHLFMRNGKIFTLNLPFPFNLTHSRFLSVKTLSAESAVTV